MKTSLFRFLFAFIRVHSGLILLPVILHAADTPRLSFTRDVVPIFTLGGCAGAACHGSIRGQNGFKLSLFGYEPELDYAAITGGDGHRVNRADPAKSLILQKPTMQVAHGGGARFSPDSLEYRTILEWIGQGAPLDAPGSPRISTLTVTPQEHLFAAPGAAVQLRATAAYTDGTTRDVTHLVAYTSNNPDVAR